MSLTAQEHQTRCSAWQSPYLHKKDIPIDGPILALTVCRLSAEEVKLQKEYSAARIFMHKYAFLLKRDKMIDKYEDSVKRAQELLGYAAHSQAHDAI